MDIPGLDNTPYRFVREIGRGGMGSVHEVEHSALGKRFVMKVLHENLAHREDFALRMQSEWRTLAKLEHPAIVQVTDAGRTSEGLPYFVMERLEGQTVADALHSRGRLPAVEAAALIVTILSGLEAAHATGAIHRDIKPQNLFITSRGPKILDFGIAKSKRPSVGLITRSGVAIGTPRYMAPEQAAGLTVDGRADIYACALVLFEMIAGRDPFSHLSDQAALVGAHINELAPRLDDIASDVPPPLADLIQRWMAKEACDRPASARLARIELEALLPLLLAAASTSDPASTSEVTLARRQNESTAGATRDPASAPPSPRPAAGRAPRSLPGGTETATLSSLLARAGEAERPASVTPPPTAEPEMLPAGRGGGRWFWASVGLFGAVAMVLGVLVLRPDLAALVGVAAPAGRAAAGPVMELTASDLEPAPGPFTPPLVAPAEQRASSQTGYPAVGAVPPEREPAARSQPVAGASSRRSSQVSRAPASRPVDPPAPPPAPGGPGPTAAEGAELPGSGLW